MGIEPTYLAWKASVLPLNYAPACLELGREKILSQGDGTRTCDLLIPNRALYVQTEPHPDKAFICLPRLDASVIIHKAGVVVNNFF